MTNRKGKSGSSDRLTFLGSKITADSDYGNEIKTHLLLGRKVIASLDSVLRKQRYHFADKGPYS